MDLFDDFDLEAQLNQLDQLEDEIRAEINMEIELDVAQFADQFAINAGQNNDMPDPQRAVNQQADQQVQAEQLPEEPAHVNPGNQENGPIQPNADNAAEVVERGPENDAQDPDVAQPTVEMSIAKEREDDDPILTPKGNEMKGFSCMICYDSFNTKSRIPKVFPCGHTFCLSCVRGLMKNRSFLSSSTVICPTCRQNSRYSTSLGAEKVPTNYCILSMLEQRKEEQSSTDEKDTIECRECHIVKNGIEVTLCNENECSSITNEELLKDFDSIKRPKCLLVCRSCIEAHHSRHNFISFEKVVAQYEVNQRICSAEEVLEKGLKSADQVLTTLKLTEAEVKNHRKRMRNALENIRAEADHPQIYEYITRYTESVKASETLFKDFIGDINSFDFKSKARYYRSFGYDMLRPISIAQRRVEDFVIPKQEPQNELPNQPARRGVLNRANRLARFNVFGPFAARNVFGNNADGINLQDPVVPNIENMLDRVLQQLDIPGGLRDLPLPAPEAPVAGGGGAMDAGGIDPNIRNNFGNRVNMWAVRAPILPRRFRRNENAREIRVIRQNLIAALAANPVLQGIPAIQQAIDGLRDNRDALDDGILPRRLMAPLADNEAFGREIHRAEEQLNRLRERLNRLEAANVNNPELDPRHPDFAAPLLPWIDQVVEEPLPRLPPIEGIDQEIIERAEVHELVMRIRNMVINEVNVVAAENGQLAPVHIEMPDLLRPELPGAVDYNNLLPEQVAPFLIELRALEAEWIQRGRDRRARRAAALAAVPAVEPVAVPIAEPIAVPVAAPVVQPVDEQVEAPINEENPPVQVEQAPVDPVLENDRGLHRRPNSPVPDEPAVKRNRL